MESLCFRTSNQVTETNTKSCENDKDDLGILLDKVTFEQNQLHLSVLENKLGTIVDYIRDTKCINGLNSIDNLDDCEYELSEYNIEDLENTDVTQIKTKVQDSNNITMENQSHLSRQSVGYILTGESQPEVNYDRQKQVEDPGGNGLLSNCVLLNKGTYDTVNRVYTTEASSQNSNMLNSNLESDRTKNHLTLRECIVNLKRLLPGIQKKLISQNIIKIAVDNTQYDSNHYSNIYKRILKNANIKLKKCYVILEKSSVIEERIKKYTLISNINDGVFKECSVILKRLSKTNLINTVRKPNTKINCNGKLFICDYCPYHTFYKGKLAIHKEIHVHKEKDVCNSITV